MKEVNFGKNATLPSWTLLQHICPHFWAWLLLYSAITPKSEDKYVVKVFNWSEFHLSEMTLLQNPYFSNIEISLFFEQICILMFNFIWIFLIQIAFIYILQFNYSVDIFLDMFLVMDERYHFGWIIHVCLIFISLGEITVCFFSNIGGQQLRLINNLILPTELTLLPNSPGISKLQQQLQEQDNIHPIIMINNMLMPNNIAHPR